MYSKKWSKMYFLTALVARVVFQTSYEGLELLRQLEIRMELHLGTLTCIASTTSIHASAQFWGT